MSGFQQQQQQQHQQQQQQQQRRHPNEQGQAMSSSSSSPLDLPSNFLHDPAIYLTSIASQIPSRSGLSALSGSVARWFVTSSSSTSSSGGASGSGSGNSGSDHDTDNTTFNPAIQVAGLYLQAAAVQLRFLDTTASSSSSRAGGMGGGGSRAAMSISAQLLLREPGGGTAAATTTRSAPHADVEQELIQTRCRNEVLEAVGAAATLCPDPMMITSSGILSTLAQLMTSSSSSTSTVSDPDRIFQELLSPTVAAATPAPAVAGTFASVALPVVFSSTNNTLPMVTSEMGNSSTSTLYPPLQQAHVEFLQCAHLSEQYQYAARTVKGTWPCPTNGTGVTVKSVLRYYYLRGIVHLGCHDYDMAHRCWWACLNVPAAESSYGVFDSDRCPPIMVQAWKKLMLVQTLMDRYMPYNGDDGNNNNNTTNSGTNPTSSSSHTGSGGLYTDQLHGQQSIRLPKAVPKCLVRLILTADDRHDHTIVPYKRLGHAIERGDPDVVRTLVRTNERLLKKDGNYHLVSQDCVRRAEMNQVWKDSQLFAVVPMTVLGVRWNIPPHLVPQRLIDSNLPHHITNDEDPMVVFADYRYGPGDDNDTKLIAGSFAVVSSGGAPKSSVVPSSSSSSSSSSARVDVLGWMQVLERMQQLDTNISSSIKYQSIVRKEERDVSGSSGGSSSSGPDFPGRGFAASIAAAGLGPLGVEDF